MIHYLDSFPGRTITIDGKEYRYFGGTAYLGLQTDVDFQNTMIKNIRKFGVHYGASRKSNVRLGIYGEVEELLAYSVGSEACVTLSSGYLAGQLLVQHLIVGGHTLFYSPNTHEALYCRKSRAYTTFAALNIALREHLASSGRETPVVLLDSVDFSGCNYPDFTWLKALPLEEVILIADDSHGLGILGSNGEGAYENLKKLGSKELIVCSSLGKGLGIQGGALFGSRKRIDGLKATSFFGGASPTPPAFLATYLQSQQRYDEKRKLLKARIQLFQTLVDDPTRFHHVPGHPAFSYLDQGLTQSLEKASIIVTDFNYPNEEATVKSRIVISAHHTEEDIAYLARSINEYTVD